MKKLRKILLLAVVCWILAPIGSKASAKPTVKESAQLPELSKWILDETGMMLYAISEKEKCLLFINAASMKVEKKITFETAPTDLTMDGNELVIAHNSSREIRIVDVKSRTIEKTIKTGYDPYSIAKDGDKLFYSSRRDRLTIFEYDMLRGSEKAIANRSDTRSCLAVNTEKHMLYVGSTENSTTEIWYYNTITRDRSVETGRKKQENLDKPVRNVYCDGGTVYYDGYRMDASDIKKSV